MRFCQQYHPFSFCLYDDADNMLFNEIHNKRVLQIMPLNTSFFGFFFPFVSLEKSFIIIIIVANATRSIRYKASRVCSRTDYLRDEINESFIISSFLFLFLSHYESHQTNAQLQSLDLIIKISVLCVSDMAQSLLVIPLTITNIKLFFHLRIGSK